MRCGIEARALTIPSVAPGPKPRAADLACLSAAGQGNLMSSLGKLISAIAKRKQAVLVITDPGQQAAYASEAALLAKAFEIGRAHV